MKRKFPISFFFLLSSLVFAQEQRIFTTKEVKELPAFPGCEKIKPTDKKQMTNCMSTQLSQMLFQKLNGFPDVMKRNGVEIAKAQLQFILTKEGVILDINELEGSNLLLADAAVASLNLISQELPPIPPAKLRNGDAVNILFQLPIMYKVELGNSREIPHTEYPVDEIVLFTLLPESKDYSYEVRLFKNKDVKIYERSKNKDLFLGKFLTLNELERSEPYQSLINNQRAKEKILVTSGTIEGEYYEIYIHNLFDQQKRKPIFVEVVNVKDDKRNIVGTFEKEAEFNASKFAPLIFRE